MLAIIDPCYHKEGGHHHSVNASLIARLSHLRPVLYADKVISISVGSNISSFGAVVPWFENLGYISPDRYDTLEKLMAVSRQFAQALRPIDSRILIAHTLLHFHLYGLALSLHSKPPTSLLISVMFSPREGLRPNQNKVDLDYQYTRMAFALLNDAARRGGHSITIAFTSEYHWHLYQDICANCPFLVFDRSPWLVGFHNLDQEDEPLPREVDSTSILLYLGDAKEDKGIFRLKGLVSKLVERVEAGRCENVDQITFCLSFGSVDDWLMPLVDEIIAMCSRHPLLFKVSHGYLSDASYFEQIDAVDAVVFLYDPLQYGTRSSGLFYDLVSFSYVNHVAKSILVPAGSWMESEAHLLGVDVTAFDLSDENWVDSLLTGCRAIRPRLDFTFRCNENLLDTYAGQSFADWTAAQPVFNDWQKIVDEARRTPDHRPLLITSTRYSHFTSLSGPTGFAKHLPFPHLPIQTRLGKSSDHQWIRDYAGLHSATDDAHHFERYLLRCTDLADWLLLSVDGEHLGSLLARCDTLAREREGKRILAWFHQPVSILRSQCIDSDRFSIQAVQPICISPCQRAFFVDELGLDDGDVLMIPHGVHAQLLGLGQRSVCARRARDSTTAKAAQVRFLIVGSWLRDHELIFAAAAKLPQHHFTWISAGMRLSEQEARLASTLSNLEIIDDGISNARLHAYYHHSDCLFQPLLDATANNAILEAMCFSLPIVTSDLPGTRWYTANQAKYYNSTEECFGLLGEMASLSNGERLRLAQPLRQRVVELDWRIVAEQFCQAFAIVRPEGLYSIPISGDS